MLSNFNNTFGIGKPFETREGLKSVDIRFDNVVFSIFISRPKIGQYKPTFATMHGSNRCQMEEKFVAANFVDYKEEIVDHTDN